MDSMNNTTATTIQEADEADHADHHQQQELSNEPHQGEELIHDDGHSSTNFSTLLNGQDDPFAPRKGRDLKWQNVNMSLYRKTKRCCGSRAPHGDGDGEGEPPIRKILDGVWGEVPPRQTTAIMGESGSGKTSLLNVLAGRVSTHGTVQVSADIRVDNVPVNPAEDVRARTMIAYVEQQDSLNVTSTPREVIRFSAKLRLPKSTSDNKLDQLTSRMLKELGLTKCSDTMIGGKMIKGLSGGERKRTSVGVELVVKPQLVFLDEPTSGLDAANAVQICQVLKSVANAGAAVLFTIHQPSSVTFLSFDRLILLNHGRIMYQGSPKDVPDVFANAGYPIPNHFNPADFIMDVCVTPVEQLEAAGFFPIDDRELPDDKAPLRSSLSLSKLASFRNSWRVRPEKKQQVGFPTQLRMLLSREFKSLGRNLAGIKTRFGLTIFMSTLIGLISLGVGAVDLNDPTNFQSIFGALMMAALTNIFTVVLPALMQFPEERPVFIREYSTNHYSVFAYFLSRVAMEAIITGGQVILSCMLTYLLIDVSQPFGLYFLSIYFLALAATAMGTMVGCSISDPSLAPEFLPPIFVPQILFAGFFVKPDLIPEFLRWLTYVFPLTYTVRILLIQEFDGSCDDNPSGTNACDQLLDDVGADPDEYWWYWIVLVGLFVLFRLMALVMLQRRAHF